METDSSSSASDDHPHHHHHHHLVTDEFNPNPPDIDSQHSRRPNLSSLQIPERSLESVASTFTRTDASSASSPTSVRAGLPPRPNSAKFKSTVKNLLPQRSFKAKNPSQDIEKTVLIIPDIPTSDGSLNRSLTSRSFSLNKIFFTSSAKSTLSLPVTPNASSGPDTSVERHLDGPANPRKPDVPHHMKRSFSVPVNIKNRSLRRTDSGGMIRVISATPRPESIDHTSQKESSTEIVNEDAGEDIPEEEAVCRICMVELSEGGDTLKMECSCKGDLALAHQECAVKWFSIKGNKTCDICKQDVRNLPVTLLKIHNSRHANRRAQSAPQQREVTRYRVWQDVPVLVMVSMLAYFCFLEQLLVSDLGPRALAISLPFACFLGLLSSMIATTMVSRSYIWAYASFQFAIVILFAHIFYTVLNVNAILSVLLSSFTGFGIAISTNSLLMEYLRWRANRQPQSSHQDINRNLHGQQRLQQHHLVQQQRVRDHRPQEHHHNHQQNNQNHHQHRLQHPTEDSNRVQSDISSQPQEAVRG